MSEPIRTVPLPRRVRAMVAGKVVVDTTAPLLVWEVPYYPTYYLPSGDVKQGSLEDRGLRTTSERGEAIVYDLVVGDVRRERAAYGYPEPVVPELAGRIAFKWKAMDHWFEEDEEVFVHVRDPYTRIDILRSSREVTVEVDGVELARSRNASFLYETGLPVRYYLPKTDVRFDLLTESDTVTHCPYKGQARYWDVTVDGKVHRDLVWGYDFPLPESQKIAGLVSFYNERVTITVGGRPI